MLVGTCGAQCVFAQLERGYGVVQLLSTGLRPLSEDDPALLPLMKISARPVHPLHIVAI